MKITFVHIVEQIQFEPQTALLSAVVRAMGHEPSRVPTDFGTKQEILTGALMAQAPDLLAVRVTGEMREAVCWSLAELRKSCPDLPILLYGPLAEDAPEELSGICDPAFLLSDETEQAMVSFLSQGALPKSLEDYDPPSGVGVAASGELRWGPALGFGDASQAPPPDFQLFGGPSFFGRGTGCSFFGDVGTALLEASIGSPSGMPANAGMRIFNYPTNKGPRSRPIAAVMAMIDDLPPDLSHIEFADREFGWMPEVEELLAGLAERANDRYFSIRQLPRTCSHDFLREAPKWGIKRVVFEYDAADAAAHARLAGSQDPELLAASIRLAKSVGLSVGLLVSVGLPGESRAEIDRKLKFIRSQEIDKLRFIPFEPRIGHPWRQKCAEEGMLPVGDGAWNRETYTPLKQSVIDDESWHMAWQDCLDLQARVALNS
ncbi:MAG: hypothetical protein ACI97A_001924 [Planctomycetota bacterium]|jgi:hypothetical protein